MYDFYGEQDQDAKGKVVFSEMNPSIEVCPYKNDETSSTMIPVEIIPIYNLVKTSDETVGVVINVTFNGYSLLLLNNKIINVGFNEQLFLLASDNTARDMKNNRMFRGDYIIVIRGQYRKYSGYVVCTYKKKVFGNFRYAQRSKKFFIDSRDCILKHDDERLFKN